MNKVIIVFLCFFGLFTASSCKKQLDTTPYNAVTDASAFETADRCLLALNGVYDAAQSGAYTDGTFRGYPFGAANIEQGDCRGEDMLNIQAFFQVTYQATYNATTANNVAMWNTLYSLINKANVAIDGFRKAGGKNVLTAAVALQYEAECRFLRAMAHHELLIHYARPYLDGNGTQLGVPWRDFPINSSTAVDLIRATPRATVATVYTNILTDLDFVENNLTAVPATFVSPATKNVRATRGAAVALKMRVKLHKGDWAGVITEGNKLIPATITPFPWTAPVSPIGSWSLTASPDGPFTDNSSVESIFSIRNDPLDAPNVNGVLPKMYGGAGFGARGLVSISPVIWNNAGWLCTDKRRTLLAAATTNASGNQSQFSTKYRKYTTSDDFTPQIRYAEVLLTQAEAEARNAASVSSRAVDLLNIVRNRSLANPATEQYTVGSFATKNDLIAAILLERRIEFLAEGKRWGDISRNAVDPNFTTGGIPAKAVNGTDGLANFVCGAGYTPGQAAIPYSDFRFLWPIPATEVVQNPIVVQNPGY